MTRNELLQRELETAPELFRRGFGLMVAQDWPAAAQVMARAAEVSDEWSDAARCCLAYCLKRLDRYADALAQLSHASPARLSPLWQWYFHHTSAHALNMVDKLPAALDACEAALEHFRSLGSDEDVANFLALKANVLKQQAFALSKTLETHAEGRVDEATLALPEPPISVDAPDYLADAERQLRQDKYIAVVGLQMPAESFATLRSTQRADRVREVLIQALGVPSYSRKAAAFALGQLGDPKAIPVLYEYRRNAPSRGDGEAAHAALEALLELSVDSGATEAERRKAVENVYHGRPVRSAEASPTRHLRDGSLTQQKPADRNETGSSKTQKGFFQRLFGG
jgi:hypothetical protein